jgi:mannose-6-phosphate isomerase-like protein (cupin superfamily)
MSTTTAPVLHPADGEMFHLGGVGARLMMDAAASGGSFALIEHPLAPRTLGAPIHTHTREDEYSYILEGRVGFVLGEETFEAGPGDFVRKPRGIPHTFFNGTDEPARLIEIITPAGYEAYFPQAAALFTGPPDIGALLALAAQYGLEMDIASMPILAQKHGLSLGPPPGAGGPGGPDGPPPGMGGPPPGA